MDMNFLDEIPATDLDFNNEDLATIARYLNLNVTSLNGNVHVTSLPVNEKIPTITVSAVVSHNDAPSLAMFIKLLSDKIKLTAHPITSSNSN